MPFLIIIKIMTGNGSKHEVTMQVMTPTAVTADWVAVSTSILHAADLPSLDDLLDEALDAWLAQAEPTLRWKVAIELYTTEQVSSGRAAEIAGLNYFVFQQKLREAGIPFLGAESTTKEEAQQQEALIHAVFNLRRA
jgi:predicted HTH domain antitoxin